MYALTYLRYLVKCINYIVLNLIIIFKLLIFNLIKLKTLLQIKKMEDCVLVKLLKNQHEKISEPFRKAFGEARYVALRHLDANFKKDDVEKGATLRVKHSFRQKSFTVLCEILDVAIVNTIPKVTDLIQTAIGIRIVKKIV